jgi:Flp pilus assembly pilin Flp
MSILKKLLREEDGQDMVEYGLVISLVVVGGVTAYTAFGTQINTGLNNVLTTLGNAL